jgi:hypothetical protein
MSVHRGRPEVAAARSKRRFGPIASIVGEADGTGIPLANPKTAYSLRGIVPQIRRPRAERGACQSGSDGGSSYLCSAARRRHYAHGRRRAARHDGRAPARTADATGSRRCLTRFESESSRCEPVHIGFLRTSLQGVGTFQGNSKWPMPVVGQGDSYDQPIPFAARQPALPPSCNSDLGFNCGFTVLLCRFRANLSDQRCLGRDGSTFSSVQNRSVLDA